MSLHILRRLTVPLILLFVAVFLRDKINQLDTVYQQLLPWLPYVLLGLCLSLAAYYNRSRIFAASLGSLAVYHLIQTELQVSLSEPQAFLIYSMLSIVVPCVLSGLLFCPERGLRNRYGVLLVVLVPLLGLIGEWMLNDFSPALLAWAQAWMAIKPVPGYVLSLLASLVFVTGLVAGLLCLQYRDGDHALMVLSVLIFNFATLAFLDQPNISLAMFSAVGIALIIGMLNSSYDMAYRDDLTGLLGRRALNDRLKGLGRRYAIAMMDVDHFKKFNDTYGHDVGDEVLKMVAGQIAAVKGGGTAYRYGGEEFCVVFAGKDIEYSVPFLESVRLAIEAYRMRLRDSRHRPQSEEVARERRGRRSKSRGAEHVSVTISIGIAERDEQHQKPEDVVKAADTALYKAKKSGRNCIQY